MARNLQETLLALYDSEINVTITMLWDGGFDFALCSYMEPLYDDLCQPERHNVPKADELADALREAALQAYPESDYAKRNAKLRHTHPSRVAFLLKYAGGQRRHGPQHHLALVANNVRLISANDSIDAATRRGYHIRLLFATHARPTGAMKPSHFTSWTQFG